MVRDRGVRGIRSFTCALGPPYGSIMDSRAFGNWSSWVYWPGKRFILHLYAQKQYVAGLLADVY